MAEHRSGPPPSLSGPLRCGCGGRLNSLADLLAMPGGDTPEDQLDLHEMWRSMVGPMDLYCWEEDEVLTEEEGWRAKGLRLPGHDEDWTWGDPRDLAPGF